MIRINDKRLLILGFTIIIASVFLGTFFASQYKSLDVSAVVAGACVCSDSKGNAVPGKCDGKNCNCGNNKQRNNKCGQSASGAAENNMNKSSCEVGGSGRTWCEGTDFNNRKYAFCTDKTSRRVNCNNVAASMGYVIKIGGGDPYTNGGWYCREGVEGYVSGPCVYNNSINSVSSVPKCFCGVIQIDGTGKNAGTYISSCGCEHDKPGSSATPTSTPTPTITPTATPTSTPTPTITPTGAPNSCGGTCGSNINCQGGLFCFIGSGQTSGFCRNPQCAQELDCNCDSIPTPPSVLGQTAPTVLPKTGGNVVSQISLFGIAVLGLYLFRKFKPS